MLQRRAAQAAPKPTRPYYGPEGPNPGRVNGAPATPNFQALLAQLAAGPTQRSESEWDSMLAPRVQPFIDSINQSTNTARGMNEFSYESKAAANQGLSEGFLKILTGGKTGAEAEQYAKEQFGGQYLPAQAMSIAADHLRDLTHDFDEADWTITSKFMELMAEVPSVREELRAKVEAQDKDAHETKVQRAALLLDETWKLYNANRDIFKDDRDFKEGQRITDEQLGMAREKLGISQKSANTSAKNAQSAAVRAATGAKNAEIRGYELKLKQARQDYTKAKDKVAQRQAQERIKVQQDNVAIARLRAQNAAKPKPKKGFTAAKKQEMAEIAMATAKDDFFGGTDDQGNPFDPRKPVETLRDLIAAGVPFSIAIRAIQRYGKDPSADAYWAATLGWKK
jgi:hypothetical protein